MPEGAKGVYVQVMQANGGQGGQGAQVKPDGSFEIWRPNPGKYTLRAMYNSSGETMGSGAVEVEVGDSDIDNIVLTLLAPEEIRGQLEFDDEWRSRAQVRQTTTSRAARRARRRRHRARHGASVPRTERDGAMEMADASEDGAFTIPKVTPGKYRVSAQGYPPT
jgi:hypothetical protein